MKQAIEQHPLAGAFLNLADYRLGSRVVQASDDFFAGAENILDLGEPVYIQNKFTHNGKWMDGWETRRRRKGGHDWCIIRLGLRGVLKGIDINTTHFAGNAPAEFSLDAAATTADIPEEGDWTELSPRGKLKPDSHNFFDIKNNERWSHLRLNIYPDGGVARVKVYGEGMPNMNNFVEGELIDLAAAENGGCSVACSDMFFSPKDNLIMPGRGVNMGDGWETRRSRRNGSSHDWNIVKLAAAGIIKKVVIDTANFKGNFPDQFSLEACNHPSDKPLPDNQKWQPLIDRTPLKADTRHIFIKEIADTASPFTHVRLNIYPDGGVSRMNIFGAIHKQQA